jgi:type IV pilus assembly protein PilV
MRIRKESGYTLVELLIAMTIFAIGLISLAGMQITAIRTKASAYNLTAAAALGEGILEEILARDPSSSIFVHDSEDNRWIFPPGSLTRTIEGGGTYTATYSVLAGDPFDSICTIIVTVKDPASRRSITLASFKQTGS